MQEYDLPSYLLLGGTIIKEFSQIDTPIPFSEIGDDYVSIFQCRLNPPITAAAKKAKETFIRHDLALMNQYIASIENKKNELNRYFNKLWGDEQKKDKSGYDLIENKYVWRQINNSFWALPQKYTFLSDASISPENLDRKSVV